MKSFALALVLCLAPFAAAQQTTNQTAPQNPPPERVKKTAPGEKIAPPSPAQAPEARPMPPEPRHEEPQHPPEHKQEAGEAAKNLKFDMTEVPPVVTHHQITSGGRTLHYTATAGRLPIKDPTGAIEAEMFFVAYTLDGQEASRRPVTFAFNGGPGSASIWLHMGALGPRKVVLAKDGFLPAAPYRLEDNPGTPLDKTDLVMVDAIGTGFSRPADMQKGKKFWGVKGDIVAFSEFIRMYISRCERWSSPLYILGESYGTTRAAGIAGYLNDRGISFNGIVLLSTVIDFETLEITKKNDLAAILTFPSYTLIAGYHKKLPPELMQDMAKTRAEVEQWARTDYAAALTKGDAMTPQERSAIIDQISRYSGLSKLLVDQANLRIDVNYFTHHLLGEQKLRVGRLDGRYTGPDPEGFVGTEFYDPTGAHTMPPFTSVFNDYLRRELNYKTDTPYYVWAGQIASDEDEDRFWRKWEWGSSIEGFPDTASQLRAAMVKNRYMKVLVMEGYYDLATPYFAANYTFDHMDLPPEYRKNISFATYDAGHMMYLRDADLLKVKKDFEEFIDGTTAR